MPGTRVKAVTSLSANAWRNAGASCTASVASAIFGPTPDTDSKVQNRSRASESAKPYSVIESSRTIIAVTSRASVPRRKVDSVDGVALTR